MTTESSTAVVRVLERRSNRVEAELDTWDSLSFTSKWRRHGSGRFKTLAGDLPARVIDLLANENVALQVIREWYRGNSDGSESKVTEEYAGPVGKFVYSTEDDPPTIELSFTDNLIYAAERVVNTDGAANIDPGVVVAGSYIQTMLNDELLAPSDGARTIDVPANFAGGAALGEQVDLPVRWKVLADVIEQACIAGEVGLVAPIVDGEIAYEVRAIRDRTTGGNDSVILSAENTGSLIRYSQDGRLTRQRVYVLGANEGAARDVETVDASTFSTGDRLREMAVDARHLSTVAEYQAHGNAVLDERSEVQRAIEVDEVDREYDIRPGDKVTVEEYLRSGATAPDIGPVDALCLTRTVTLSPGQPDRVGLEVGSEVPSSALLLRAVDRKDNQARFV